MTPETRVCHWCYNAVPKEDFCPTCLEAFPKRAAAHTMTADEREAEMTILRWTEVPFDMIHGRIEQLVGRPVWTHELGLNYAGVIKESRWEGRSATMDEIVNLIPEEKRMIFPMSEQEARQ